MIINRVTHIRSTDYKGLSVSRLFIGDQVRARELIVQEN